tara:strand:+ start:68 stop:406 length:339 start_codon:yes stop_codon:yes gene_type:complete
MSHFAKVEDGIVTDVTVAEQDFIDRLEGTWIQTSYNTYGGVHSESGTPLRKNYAGIGYIYDAVRDVFYAPQPFASWTLNETTCQWDSPVAYPDDGKLYTWDEETTNWVESDG